MAHYNHQDGKTYFVHSNGLGSTSQVTDPTGTLVVEDQLFYAFGQDWDRRIIGAMQEDRFAQLGHWDPETDLYPTPNRMFASSKGRWMIPDPLGGDIANPQTLNRYAYVLNNPTSLIDPLGLVEGCTPGAQCVTVTARAPYAWLLSGFSLRQISCILGFGWCGGSNPFLSRTRPTPSPDTGGEGTETDPAPAPAPGPAPAPTPPAPKPTPAVQLSPQAQACFEKTRSELNQELETFSGYASVRIFGRALFGAGIGAVKGMQRASRTDNPWAIAGGAVVGAVTGAVLSTYADSRTIQRIQNSFMDKFSACLQSSSKPQPPQ